MWPLNVVIQQMGEDRSVTKPSKHSEQLMFVVTEYKEKHGTVKTMS